jgi:WS/DGAT/MGAT family acyltransferase
MQKIKLNTVDHAWLRMESPSNLMMITVMFKFDGQVDQERLVSSLETVVKRYRRFHQRIVIPTGFMRRPYWEDDPSDRIEDHIQVIQPDHPLTDAMVSDLVNQQMNKPLDFSHPLWRLTLLDNHPDGTIAIVCVHHCIADGISLLQVFLRMTQTAPDGPNPILNGNGTINEQDPLVTPTMAQAGVLKNDALPTTSSKPAPQIKPGVKDLLAAAMRIVFRPADPPTILKASLNGVKKAVWSEPLDVPDLKRIAQSKGATINDTLMSITTGAIRRYIDLQGDNRKPNIRAFILVNMRGRSFDEELGNKFGLVFLNLPLDREQPVERLETIKNGMDILKASAEYAATYFILHILGLVPKWVEDIAIKILDTKGTIVATNVPGARKQLYLAGAPITSIIAWVPQSGRVGVGISFVSYNDQLIVGLNADTGLIPDPHTFLQLFTEEYQALRASIIEPSPDLV